MNTKLSTLQYTTRISQAKHFTSPSKKEQSCSSFITTVGNEQVEHEMSTKQQKHMYLIFKPHSLFMELSKFHHHGRYGIEHLSSSLLFLKREVHLFD